MIYTKSYAAPRGAPILVEAGADMEPLFHLLHSLVVILIIVMPVILLGAAVGGHLLMAGPLRPVVALTEQAEHIGRKELGERLAGHSLRRRVGTAFAGLEPNDRPAGGSIGAQSALLGRCLARVAHSAHHHPRRIGGSPGDSGARYARRWKESAARLTKATACRASSII